MTALLHDVLEDSELTGTISIKRASPSIAAAVAALTRQIDETYEGVYRADCRGSLGPPGENPRYPRQPQPQALEVC